MVFQKFHDFFFADFPLLDELSLLSSEVRSRIGIDDLIKYPVLFQYAIPSILIAELFQDTGSVFGLLEQPHCLDLFLNRLHSVFIKVYVHLTRFADFCWSYIWQIIVTFILGIPNEMRVLLLWW